MAELKIDPPPLEEPVDLSDQLGAQEMAEEVPSPSAAEMMAAQRAAMRARELEAQERQAKKFGTVPHQYVDAATNHPLIPVPGNGTYRWLFADNGNEVTLHNIPPEMADDFDDLLTKHQVAYTRYRQVLDWAAD